MFLLSGSHSYWKTSLLEDNDLRKYPDEKSVGKSQGQVQGRQLLQFKSI